MFKMQVNNNGDTAATLKAQILAVRHAAEGLKEAIAGAAPHGRNYQTNDAPQKDFKHDVDILRAMYREVDDISTAAMQCAIQLNKNSCR